MDHHETTPLYTSSRRKPVLDENIEAEKIKLAIADKFPGRIELALAHQAANKFGAVKRDFFETCACCDVKIGNVELPFNSHLENENCPSGIVLTFSLIRMTIFFMLLHFSVTGLYNVYSNLKGHECITETNDKSGCKSLNVLLLSSPANKSTR